MTFFSTPDRGNLISLGFRKRTWMDSCAGGWVAPSPSQFLTFQAFRAVFLNVLWVRY